MVTSNKKIFFIASSIIVMIFLIMPAPAYLAGAPVSESGLNDGFQNAKTKSEASGLSTRDFFEILQDFILWMLGFVAVIALAALIWGGFMYILALGDEQRAATAKKIILYAVIGVIITGASFIIISTLKALLVA